MDPSMASVGDWLNYSIAWMGNKYNYMLKFLDNRRNEKASKSPKKFEPQMLYGISAEAPQAFQTPYTIVHQKSYVNPFVEFEKRREVKLPASKSTTINPQWKNKTNLQLVEEQKIVSCHIEGPQKFPNSRYQASYKEQLDDSPKRFMITRGEFTNFIERNNHYKSIGPLHGEERTMERIQNTKNSVWLKPDRSCASKLTKKNSILYTNYFNEMRSSSNSNFTTMSKNQICIANNSKLITQKSIVRDNRDKMNTSFRVSLQKRKKTTPFNFGLPKLHFSHSETDGIKMKEKARPSSELKDLQQFQSKLKKQFK